MTILDDGGSEADQTVNLALSSPGNGAALGAQSTAAPVASAITTVPFADGASGCAWLTSQKPARAGRKNHANRGRGRSPSRSAAPPTATNGCTFWITTGVM